MDGLCSEVENGFCLQQSFGLKILKSVSHSKQGPNLSLRWDINKNDFLTQQIHRSFDFNRVD